MNYGAQARSRLNHVTLEQSNPKLETKDHHSPGEWRGKQRGEGKAEGRRSWVGWPPGGSVVGWVVANRVVADKVVVRPGRFASNRCS